jgi:Kef-type K+ transport system membrane component KefB
MIFAARPLVRRFVERQEGRGLTEGVLAVVCVALLLSSLITESIGIHAIFGAFLLGATVPHASRLARELTDRLQAIVLVLFLPAFFALTGLRTELGLVDGAADWAVTLAIILVASVGKFGGSFAAARWTGLGSRDAAAIGILMNTRGLMELIVLNVGLSLGIISPRLFAMLVVMAVVTTLATTPILLAIGPDRGAEEA